MPLTGTRLLGAMIAPVKTKYFTLLLCKILDDSLSFAAPLILGDLVEVVSAESPETEEQTSLLSGLVVEPVLRMLRHAGLVQKCTVLASLLFLAALLKAVVTTQYTYHLNLMAIRAHGSLMQAPLRAALSMPAYIRGRFPEGAYHWYGLFCPFRWVSQALFELDGWPVPHATVP